MAPEGATREKQFTKNAFLEEDDVQAIDKNSDKKPTVSPVYFPNPEWTQPADQ